MVLSGLRLGHHWTSCAQLLCLSNRRPQRACLIAGLGTIMVFSWMAIESPTGLYVCTDFSGSALGGIQSTFYSTLASLNPASRKRESA